MKTWFFWLVLILVCGCRKKTLDERFMEVGRYVVEHCAGSVAYDSLPSRYTRAMQMGRDSAERLVRVLEGDVKRGVCPD